MPIYEYKCEACGHQLEAMQKFSEEPLKECPTCGKPALNKLISASGFQLKGSGWYVTDYRDKGKSKPTAETGEGSSDDSKSTDTTKSTESAETKSDDAKSSGTQSSSDTKSSDKKSNDSTAV